MSFAAGYKGDECLARSANTFQPRAQHIGQGSRAKSRFPRQMDPQDVYQVRHAPAFGDPPHSGGLQHFPQLRSSVKAVGPGSSRRGGCADDATVRRWPASSSGEFEIVTYKQYLVDRLNTPDILCRAT